MVTKKVVITSFEFPWSVKFRPLRPAPSSALGRNMQKCKANAGRGQGVASPAPGKLVTVYPQKKYSGMFSLLFWDFSSTHYNAPLLAAIACKHVPWTYDSLSLWQLDRALSVEGDDYKGRMLLFMVGHIMHGKQLDPRAMQQWYR